VFASAWEGQRRGLLRPLHRNSYPAEY